MPSLQRAQSAVEGSLSKRNIRRFLSCQRHLKSAHLCLSMSNEDLLYMLDEEYFGQAKCMLKDVGNWNFDIFLFERLTNGNSVVTLMCHLFNHCRLLEEFRLDIYKLRRFLVLVQEDYHSQNPYHNGVHAADVTQAMYCYLTDPKLVLTVKPWDVIVSLIAACTHDLDHPGYNQIFLIKTKHHLASLYKNTSVLENHHWRSAVGLLRETGLFSHLPPADRKLMEMQIGSLILATDITRQNEYLSSFTSHLDKHDLCLRKPCHQLFVLQMAIKCADISNPCRPWHSYKQWSEQVVEEFFSQGDLERKHRVEVSPLCDRHTHTEAGIQIGFISYLVEPLFIQWDRLCNSRLSNAMMGLLEKNKERWQQMHNEQASTGGKTAQEKKD